MVSKRRFLVVTLDAAGNWPPELAIIRALVQRGHEVRVISDPNHMTEIREAGAEYRPYQFTRNFESNARPDNPHESQMEQTARVLREVLLNPAFGDQLLAEVARDAPDVLLVDFMLMTAAAAAESTGLPTASLFHTVYGAVANARSRVPSPVLDQLNALREKMGLAGLTDLYSLERADAIIAFTYEEFDTVPANRSARLHYVGPLACLPKPLLAYSLPWAPDDARPLILVSYSTSFQDQVEALQRVADAVATLPVRVLLTLGNAISADELLLPGNVVAEKFVPHAAVLPHASLVVTHAGHGTVMAAVTAGVPMVCVPMGRDQHVVSGCVERLGLGLVASVAASPEELRSTIMAALKDDGLRQRAQNFAAGLDVKAGLHRAIEVLENLRAA